MAGADWSNTVTVNINLAASPPARAGFGTMLYLVNEDDGNDLDGDRVVSYADVTEAQAAQTAGDISATTLAAITDLFSQVPRPAKVKVARVDTAADPAETYVDALAAVEAIDTDWYGVACDSRADAVIVALATAIEARDKLFFAQTDDASMLDASLPTGLSSLAGLEHTALVYHDTDAEPADLAWAASRLVHDPDTKSAPWEGRVRAVSGLATGLTSAQRDAIVANKANVALPFSSATLYMSPGQNMAGRGIYWIVSAHWLAARISEDAAKLKLDHTDRGEKLTLDAIGQGKILAIINGRLQQGETAGHWSRGEFRATAEEITDTDRDARRLRFKIEAQIAEDARDFVFNVYLQSTPVQTE